MVYKKGMIFTKNPYRTNNVLMDTNINEGTKTIDGVIVHSKPNDTKYKIGDYLENISIDEFPDEFIGTLTVNNVSL